MSTYKVERFYGSWQVVNTRTGLLVGRYAQRGVAEREATRREALSDVPRPGYMGNINGPGCDPDVP